MGLRQGRRDKGGDQLDAIPSQNPSLLWGEVRGCGGGDVAAPLKIRTRLMIGTCPLIDTLEKVIRLFNFCTDVMSVGQTE
jgi:hypothetical protein